MCGIAGFWSKKCKDPEIIGKRMASSIIHRGPDDYGVWYDSSIGVVLAHRRLSIIDRSAAGHQPMVSSCGRYTIVFNGEIYNNSDLRNQLSNVRWRGYSDTETLLEGFSKWGIIKTIKLSVGMFAIAVWDNFEKKLFLIRDRLGEKPLYYGWQDNTFLFGSELKSLRAHPSWKGEINRQALSLFLRYDYIPSPLTIHTDIYKLLPGTILTFCYNEQLDSVCKFSEPITYWDPVQNALKGKENPFVGSQDDAICYLDNLLKQTIRDQMIADVPIGAFLSGGIDSSLIVAIMQTQSKLPVQSFSIGFKEPKFDEAPYAKAIAQHIGTKHTELYVSETDLQNLIPELPVVWDEPFGDSSQIPTLILSRLTKQFVTVSLSGDAGDELFGGYNRYFECKLLWDSIKYLPIPIRNLLSTFLGAISPSIWNYLGSPFSTILKGKAGDKIHKLLPIIKCKNFNQFYNFFVSHWFWPEHVVINGSEPTTSITDNSNSCLNNLVERMMLTDIKTYLPDDILVKVDRAAMACSLETRVPFLDHRIVEFSFSLPFSYKVHDSNGKWILKQLLKKYVPNHLFERPKKGFGVPLNKWLQGPLRDWVDSLISEPRLKLEGFFNAKPISDTWKEHLSGKRNWQYRLWNIIMFQAWLDNQLKY